MFHNGVISVFIGDMYEIASCRYSTGEEEERVEDLVPFGKCRYEDGPLRMRVKAVEEEEDYYIQLMTGGNPRIVTYLERLVQISGILTAMKYLVHTDEIPKSLV